MVVLMPRISAHNSCALLTFRQPLIPTYDDGARAPNVMVQRDTKKVLHIDFDWSGKEGVVHYPSHLSKGLWVDAVSPMARKI